MDDQPLPPWLAAPDIPRGSIGWRMGYGEDISHNWQNWFGQLNEAQKDDYFLRYPPPVEWQDWCEFHRKFRDINNG